MTQLYKETIGEFVKKHITDNKTWVDLNKYVYDYLNEEDAGLFRDLMVCIPAFNFVYRFLIAKIDMYGDVIVCGNKHKCYTSYHYNYPVVDVYKDLIAKMSIYVKLCLNSIKEEYAKNKELRIWAKSNAATWNTINHFAKDYGIKFKIVWDDNLKTPYMDIIGITDNE